MTTQEQKDHDLKIKLERYLHDDAYIGSLIDNLNELAGEIVEAHCPYKVGDLVEYTEWWRKGVVNTGVVHSTPTLNISDGAIDGLWSVIVQPTKKNGQPHSGKHPIHLGVKWKGDSIKHIEVKP